MCGIAGYFSTNQNLTAGILKRMTDLVAHRGPDGEGFVLGNCDGVRFLSGPETPTTGWQQLPHAPIGRLDVDERGWSWGLGHRRLAIIDLKSTGHQPMCTQGARYVITYNGEIYNYVELREELIREGFSFFGHSDTEVILAAYSLWGVDCLMRLNGMFAFVLVDRLAGKVFAARDRFGVKPLYMYRSSDGIAFASEIKQFSALPGWSPSAVWQPVHDFLSSGIADHTSETMFSGVTQLRGGHFIFAPIECLREAQPTGWYDLAGQQRINVGSFEEAAIRFAALFSDAVRLRLRADVPVGTALSGGLDSSSIVCEVSAQLRAISKGVQKSFSICSEFPKFDERHFVDVVTQATGVDAKHAYPNTDGLREALPDIVWHQDEPFAGTSIFAEWEVYKLARSHGVKVTLDGHGADEMLGGYHTFFWTYLNDLLMRGRVDQWLKEVRAVSRTHGYGLGDILRSQLVTAVPTKWVRPVRNLLRGEGATSNILACSPRELSHQDDVRERLSPLRNPVRSECVRQLTTTSVPVQLHWADRDSMAHSIESRFPFLDYRLVEFVLSCPPEYTVGGGTTKRILRAGLAHRLPREITERQDKMGFVTPEQAWLCDQEGANLMQWLDHRRDLALNFISHASFDRARRILAGRERYNRFAWRVLSLVMWAERFSVRGV